MGPTERTPTPLVIVFIDLTRYAAQSQRVDDVELADTMDRYYELVSHAVETAGGTTVKFIGDAALIVFDDTRADDALRMVLELKTAVDRFMEDHGWDCRLAAKVHFGVAVAGPFGGVGRKTFDVLGRAVNAAAVLESTDITVSDDAFRKLSPAMQQRFRERR
jgi:adenylate cyclase